MDREASPADRYVLFDEYVEGAASPAAGEAWGDMMLPGLYLCLCLLEIYGFFDTRLVCIYLFDSPVASADWTAPPPHIE